MQIYLTFSSALFVKKGLEFWNYSHFFFSYILDSIVKKIKGFKFL